MNNFYDKYQYLSCFEMLEDDKNWWLSDVKWNNIFKISKSTLNIKKMMDIDWENFAFEGAYSYIISYKEKIIFLPQNSSSVMIYNKEYNQIEFVLLNIKKEQKSYGTAGYVLLGNKLYVFSSYEKCNPFVMNIDTMKVKYLNSWEEQIKYFSIEESWFINSVFEEDGYIFLGLYNNNIILKYNPEQNTYEKILLNHEKLKINKIYKDKENNKIIILSNYNNEIIECSLINGQIKIDRIWNSHLNDSKIINLLFDNSEIILLPKNGNTLEIINRASGRFSNVFIPVKYILQYNNQDNSYFYGGKVDNEFIYLFPFLSRGIIYIDRKTKNIYMLELKMDKNELEELYQSYIFRNGEKSIICDEKKVSIDMFLGLYKQKKFSRYNANLNIGKSIYNHC